jgi:hypothetical protein
MQLKVTINVYVDPDVWHSYSASRDDVVTIAEIREEVREYVARSLRNHMLCGGHRVDSLFVREDGL